MSDIRYRPSCAVITVPDPDEEPFHYYVEEGGILEIRSESRLDFDVVVKPANPAVHGFTKSKSGSCSQPAMIPIPLDSAGEYILQVSYLRKGTGKPQPPPIEFAMNIIPCTACSPRGSK